MVALWLTAEVDAGATVTSTPVAMGTSPTLSELVSRQALTTAVARASGEAEPTFTALPLKARPAPPPGIDASIGVDPALAIPSEPMVPIAGPQTAFDGIANIDQAPIVGTTLPPDPVGDVGPNHYVQAVNTTFAVFDKLGNRLVGPLSLHSLFLSLGPTPCASLPNRGDPVVLYDELADRWLISQFAFTTDMAGTAVAPFNQCLAVSQTSDPTGAYFVYEYTISTTHFPDYPKLGVWPDGYYLSANAFDLATSGGVGGFAAVFERDRTLAGNPGDPPRMVLEFSGPSEGEPSTFGLLPADLDGTTPPPPGSAGLFLVLRNLNLGDAFDGLEVWEARPTWTPPPGLPTFSFTLAATLPVERFDSALCSANANIRNCIPQPGSAFGLDALPGQLMHRLAYRNIAGIESLVVNHVVDVSGSDHAGIRWYELRRAAGVWSVAQQNSFAPDADHRWVASTAMDAAGNIALGYSVSGLTTFPSLRFVGRFSTDAPSLLTHGEQTLIAGGGSQTHPSSRWGDYSTLSVDPADGCTFWFTGEYYPLTDTAGWRTHIGSFTLLGNPLVTSTSHSPAVWSNDPTVDVAWTPPSANCGVDGYSFSWDQDAAGAPGTAKDLEETETTTISPPLADGESNYLHLQGIDNAGNVSDVVTFGPLQIDSAKPDPREAARDTPETDLPAGPELRDEGVGERHGQRHRHVRGGGSARDGQAQVRQAQGRRQGGH